MKKFVRYNKGHFYMDNMNIRINNDTPVEEVELTDISKEDIVKLMKNPKDRKFIDKLRKKA